MIVITGTLWCQSRRHWPVQTPLERRWRKIRSRWKWLQTWHVSSYRTIGLAEGIWLQRTCEWKTRNYYTIIFLFAKHTRSEKKWIIASPVNDNDVYDIVFVFFLAKNIFFLSKCNCQRELYYKVCKTFYKEFSHW